MRAVADWKELIDGKPALVEAAVDLLGSCESPHPSDIERLRREYDASFIPLALDLARARLRARTKFPESAGRLVADPVGVEQATSELVATHKAERFATAPGMPVLDLCCGIGGDLMSLASDDPRVTGVDLDPARAFMAGRNAGCPTITADVSDVDVTDHLVHLDPARRDADGRRRHDYGQLIPPPELCERLLDTARGGALKLGPGVALDELPAADREVEIVNERGTLVQAILWTGVLARHPGSRTVTRLPGGASFTAAPAPAPAAGDLAAFLVVPDPALERASLVGPRCELLDVELRELHPGLGLLTCAANIDDPWFACFEVLAHCPWRTERLTATIREVGTTDGATVIVRTRGAAVDVDSAQRTLQSAAGMLNPDRELVVFGLRLGQRRIGVITRRVVH